MIGWTELDEAEIAVLADALATGYFDHREDCRACHPGPCPDAETWLIHKTECRGCRGDGAALPCERKAAFIAHGDNCPRCNPCPHVRRAIDEVVKWRDARALLSRAESLRRPNGKPAAYTTPFGLGWIAPHGDQELELLLAGEKPAAMLTRREALEAHAHGLPIVNHTEQGWLAGQDQASLDQLVAAIDGQHADPLARNVAIGLALGYSRADVVAFAIQVAIHYVEAAA